MNKLLTFIVLLMISFSLKANEAIVFFGKLISNEYISEASVDCPEGNICMNSPYRFEIKVESLLQRELTTDVIKAARIQHSKYVSFPKTKQLFVIREIEDKEKQDLLGSKYWLEEYSKPKTIYCLSKSGKQYGIEDNSEQLGQFLKTNCYVEYDNW